MYKWYSADEKIPSPGEVVIGYWDIYGKEFECYYEHSPGTWYVCGNYGAIFCALRPNRWRYKKEKLSPKEEVVSFIIDNKLRFVE